MCSGTANFFYPVTRGKGEDMTDILQMMGMEGVTKMASVLVLFATVCAVLVSLVTEALKAVPAVDAMPTKLVCYLAALILTTPCFLAMMAWLGQPVRWYMVFASFMASFIVAKVSMSGWDDLMELAGRLSLRR